MNEARLWNVILAPVVSEKATRVAERREFVFKVRPDASKAEIREAVERVFGVEVAQVRTLNVQGKRKRAGRSFGQRKDWKKSYVTLKPGHDIDYSGQA
jgi:large subunit ribosomal protein L23